MPNPTRRTVSRGLGVLSIALIAPFATPAPPAAADEVASLREGPYRFTSRPNGDRIPTRGPVIQVEYDAGRREWVRVRHEPRSISTETKGRCPERWRQARAVLSIDDHDQWIPVNKNNRTYAADWRQIWFEANSFLPDLDPVAACNTEILARVHRGQSRTRLVEEGFVVEVSGAYRGSFVLRCSHKPRPGGFSQGTRLHSDTAPFRAWIDCRPGPPAQRTAPKPAIEKLTLAAAPVSYEGCPATVHVGGTIEARRRADLSCRFSGHDGFRSETFRLTVQPGTKPVQYHREVDPRTPPPVASPAPPLPPGHGWLAFTCSWTDYGGKVETLSSNRAAFQIRCPPPGPTVTAPAGGSGSSPPRVRRADLVIPTAAVVPGAKLARIRVKVANVGTGPAAPTRLKTFVRKGGQLIATNHVGVPPLEPGDERWVLVELGIPLTPEIEVSFRVDDPSVVQESDEGNNTFELD